ncbi:hypothetical protein VCHA28FP16_360001 [Vibrio chagasii]|nr:hypothetical protein VCHA28FP16_360001 [Vibrio chagasii]
MTRPIYMFGIHDEKRFPITLNGMDSPPQLTASAKVTGANQNRSPYHE